MTEKHYVGFEQIAEADIEAKSVASLRNVPGRGGTYGENGLTAEGLKERFDALPKLAIERLHALLAYLDAYINGEENGLESRLKAIGDKADDIAIGLDEEATKREEGLAKKLDTPKNSGSNKVLVSRYNGEVTLWGMSSLPQKGAVAMFADDGTLRTNRATDDTNAVPLAQLRELLTALKSELLGGASGAYDTLKELEDALKDNDSDVVAILKAIAAVEASLAGKVDTKDVSTTATPDTIAKRISGGRLAVGRAAADSDAVPYKQMREELERYLADGGGLDPDLLDSITNAIKMIDTLEAKVANLEAGIAPDMFVVDDTTAYVKAIPADAKPYAELLAVGGMTHKVEQLGENLFDASTVPPAEGLYVYEDGTIDADYMYAFNGSMPPNFFHLFPSSVVGKTYILSVSATGGDLYPAYVSFQGANFTLDAPFTLTEEQRNCYVNLNTGYDDDGGAGQACGGTYTFSLREVTDVLLDTPVTALDVLGKNIYNGGFGGTECATEENGVLTMTRTSNDRWTKSWYPPIPLSEASIAFNLTANGITIELNAEVTYESGKKHYVNLVFPTTQLGQKVSKIPASADGTKIKSVMLYINANENAGSSAKLKDIMILPTATPTDTTYSPYRKTTFAIPAAVQALDGYGWGVDGAVNGIEWDENGKPVYVKRVERVVFDGTENWGTTDTAGAETTGKWRNHVWSAALPLYRADSDVYPVVCNHYDAKSAAQTWYCVTGVSPSREGFYFYDDAYSTKDVSLWKAHLAELNQSGNPLTVYYELAEPIVTDVSAYFTEDNLIPVEGGGTITAVNEHALAAPSTIVYQKRGV